MFSIPQGKPGVVGNYDSQPREVFYSGREFAQFWAPPVTIDGTNSSNPLNSPYTWLLWAGTPMGRITATGKYANSILGLTGAAAASGATSITTDVNTAAEIVRRIGATGTFKLTGPPAAAGTVATAGRHLFRGQYDAPASSPAPRCPRRLSAAFADPADRWQRNHSHALVRNRWPADRRSDAHQSRGCILRHASGRRRNDQHGNDRELSVGSEPEGVCEIVAAGTCPGVTFLDDITG